MLWSHCPSNNSAIRNDSEDGLNRINQVLTDFIKIKLNKSKTKVLVCTKNEQTRKEWCIKISGENLEGIYSR